MRILIIADAVFEDVAGGSRLAARELARGLAARGHDVVFLAPRHPLRAGMTAPPDDEIKDGIRIVRYEGLGRAASFMRCGRRAAAALQREQPFDIAHTQFAYAALGPLLALSSHTPRVRTFHGPWDEEGWIEEAGAATNRYARLKARLKRIARCQVERFDLNRSDAVIVLSRYLQEELVRRFHVEPARTHKIVGGVDAARFKPARNKAQVRRALNLPEDGKIVLTIRRLAARMGLNNLIDSMPAVLAAQPRALLMIGGVGPEKAKIEARIAKMGLQESVRLLGFIPDEQLARYYQAADLFALPTTALEGFGLVTVEALSSGVPVVGTAIGATPEILTGIPGCVVCSEIAPDALAKGIIAALAKAGGEESLAPQELHEMVKARYSWERHVEQTQAVYEAAIAQRMKAGARRTRVMMADQVSESIVSAAESAR